MVMTDVSGTKERADLLGKLGVAYGIGMMIGPPIGGELFLLLLCGSHPLLVQVM